MKNSEIATKMPNQNEGAKGFYMFIQKALQSANVTCYSPLRLHNLTLRYLTGTYNMFTWEFYGHIVLS